MTIDKRKMPVDGIDPTGSTPGQVIVSDGTIASWDSSGSSYDELSDTSNSKTGQAGNVPVVNAAETALEYQPVGAKAWVSFNGITGAIYNSYNVSSITKNAAGSYDVNFTTPMVNNTYTVAGSATDLSDGGNGTLMRVLSLRGNNAGILPTTTTAAAVMTYYADQNNIDCEVVNVIVLGD